MYKYKSILSSGFSTQSSNELITRKETDKMTVDGNETRQAERKQYLLYEKISTLFQLEDSVPGVYLCNFEELRNPCHSSEKLLIYIKTFFALVLFHIKVFFYKQQE